MSIIEKRLCPYHGKTDFVKRKNGHFACKKCAVENVTKRRREFKEKLIKYKGGKCEICGYDKCVDALEFHHLEPNKKEFTISGKIISLERAKKEIDKCILVCANCHREIHYRERIEKIKIFDVVPLNKNKKYIDKEIVLKLIKEGKTQKNIASEINVSLSTLKRFLHSNDIGKKGDIV